MNPKTHCQVLSISVIAVTVVLILAIFPGDLREHNSSLMVWLVCGWMIGLPILGLMWIYLAPVRCRQTGCGGRMAPSWRAEDPAFRWRLIYNCETCGNVHISDFTFGLGDGSW